MPQKIIYWLKINWHVLALGFIAVLFFLGAASFNFFTQSYGTGNNYDYVKWAAPDETANYIFTKLYANEATITLFEKYNLYIKDLIHPRSFRSDWGNLKPVSFLGIILIYGKIAALTTYKVIPYLTPLFAAFGLIYYYLLVKEIFNRRNALISVFLAASFPVYIYYSARSMFHNVLFLVLLIIGLYYLVIMNRQRTNRYWGYLAAGLGGLFIGLAAITRSSELLWLAPLLVILWLFNIRKTGLIKIIIFGIGLFLAVLPAFYYNQVLYGSYYFGGYPDMNRSIMNIKSAGLDLIGVAAKNQGTALSSIFQKIKSNIFYFGLDYYKSAKMFYWYFVNMFAWIFWPAMLGLITWLFKWRRLKYRQVVYVVVLTIAAIILIFYYGSWEFHDNPDPRQHTIGNSYTRYWLPIYLGLLPFVSLLILYVTRSISYLFKFLPRRKDEDKKFFSLELNPNYLKVFFRIAILAVIFFWSISFALFSSDEGLYYLAQRQNTARAEWGKVISLTEPNSVIVTQYHDKLFFPERKVIVGLFDDPNMITEYAVLAQKLPVYYYNFTFPDKTLEFLNRSRLGAANLQIEPVKQITKDFTLYKLNYKTIEQKGGSNGQEKKENVKKEKAD